MKISIIGPGIMPIPPTGWGAVEILIWDQKLALEKLGHEVDIVNTKSPVEIVQKINAYRPDFVHIQYDDFIELYPYIQYPCASQVTLDILSNQTNGDTIMIVLSNHFKESLQKYSVYLMVSKMYMKKNY